MTDPWYESAFGEHYPAIYAHRNAREAHALARTVAGSVSLGGARVLDVACGGGRHLEAMGREGARMTGVDLSLALLRVVRPGERIVRGDMRALPFRTGSFDGACNVFTSFGYFASPDENSAVLAEIRRVLRPGGWFLFDYLNAAPTLAGLVASSERTAGPYHLAEKRSYDSGTRILTKTVVLTDPDAGDERRWTEELLVYASDDLRNLLHDTGFREREAWGGYDGEPFAPETSPRLVLLLETGP